MDMDVMNTSDHFLSVFLNVLEKELSYGPSQESYFKTDFRKKNCLLSPLRKHI